MKSRSFEGLAQKSPFHKASPDPTCRELPSSRAAHGTWPFSRSSVGPQPARVFCGGSAWDLGLFFLSNLLSVPKLTVVLGIEMVFSECLLR